VTDAVREQVMSLPHRWSHDRPGIHLATAVVHAGVDDNAPTEPGPQHPPSGTAVLNGIPVTLTPA